MKNWFLRMSVLALSLMPFHAHAAGCGSSQQASGVRAVAGACNDAALAGRVNRVINALFIVAGAIAVIILIAGGIRYITSTGDSTRIQKAKDTILYAVIGLIVVILARAIVGFVIGQIA